MAVNADDVRVDTPKDDEDATSPSTTSSIHESPAHEAPQSPPLWRRVLSVIAWTPPNCRWDPEKPPTFTLSLNILFAFAAAFTVANLYYNHPILNILAEAFDVEYEKAAQIPTLMQAGYAGGLFFLNPLGDLFKRRAFVLILVFITAAIWIGLCVTDNFAVFSTLSFIAGFTTVTPQLMLPLVGDLAPVHRRATALSITVSGFLLGMLMARLFSGVLTNYTSWRNIYWFALGIQSLIFVLLWLFMPDYPSTNPSGINYFRMLWSVLLMFKRHPVVVQASLIGGLIAATFTSFWTTLTFLLSGAPYHYSPLVIGLFALIGIGAMTLGPPFARAVTDRFVPLLSVIVGASIALAGIIIGTYTGRTTVVGPILEAFFIDLGLQTSQIANRTAIYSVEPKGRNRVNTAYMVSVFAGQLTGTAVGNKLYAEGGWVASGSCNVGFIVLALLATAARGPWEHGWLGWSGGWSFRKKEKPSGDGKENAPGQEHLQSQPQPQPIVGNEDLEKAG